MFCDEAIRKMHSSLLAEISRPQTRLEKKVGNSKGRLSRTESKAREVSVYASPPLSFVKLEY